MFHLRTAKDYARGVRWVAIGPDARRAPPGRVRMPRRNYSFDSSARFSLRHLALALRIMRPVRARPPVAVSGWRRGDGCDCGCWDFRPSDSSGKRE